MTINPTGTNTKPMGSSLSSRAQVVVLVAPPLLAVLPPEPVLPPGKAHLGAGSFHAQRGGFRETRAYDSGFEDLLGRLGL